MRITVTGAGGQLGRQLVTALGGVGEVTALRHEDLDLADPGAVARLAATEPDVVVNSAAWTDVDGCARDPERAMELNGHAPGRLAAATDALFVQVSTNEVFAGDREAPYAEDDEPAPGNPYGASKLAGERAVRAAAQRHLVVRTAWLFGPGSANFVTRILAAAHAAEERGETARVVDDEWGNPTWTPALAAAVAAAVALPEDVRPAVLHLAGDPPTTRFGWAQRILGSDPTLPPPAPVPGATFNRPSRVPPRAVLSTRRAEDLGLAPLDWQAPLADYLASLEAPA